MLGIFGEQRVVTKNAEAFLGKLDLDERILAKAPGSIYLSMIRRKKEDLPLTGRDLLKVLDVIIEKLESNFSFGQNKYLFFHGLNKNIINMLETYSEKGAVEQMNPEKFRALEEELFTFGEPTFLYRISLENLKKIRNNFIRKKVLHKT